MPASASPCSPSACGTSTSGRAAAACVGIPSVAVLIPTYNEGPEILVPTIAAAVALEPAHETWVLDDGERPEIAELAASLGARYLARPTHEHAKAGNVNHALGVIDAEIMAFLDADHVAAPDFLRATLGYFADQRVALVQTPQDFYNVTSFEHGSGTGLRASRSTSRRSSIGCSSPARTDGTRPSGAAPARSSASRRSAAVGGAATDTITEDIHTTIRLHRAAGRPSITTRCWRVASRPTTPASTSSSATDGGPARCRCCASRIRSSVAA